jgi:general secretion pathway protein A
VAGAQGNITFSNGALSEIYQYSKGIPRLINILCDRALLAGFVDQTYQIDRRIVDKARVSLLGKEGDARPLRFFTRFFRKISLRRVFQ